jgi:polygalacturonase
VTIRGITIRRAPNYAISLLGTDYVDVDGVTTVDAYADAIDPDSSRFVRISNVYFEGWDDAIVAKASLALGYPRSTENLTVTNCVLTTNSCYLRFGSESAGEFRNVAFTNGALYRRRNEDPRNLAAVSLEANDGGIVDGVVISNISVAAVQYGTTFSGKIMTAACADIASCWIRRADRHGTIGLGVSWAMAPNAVFTVTQPVGGSGSAR